VVYTGSNFVKNIRLTRRAPHRLQAPSLLSQSATALYRDRSRTGSGVGSAQALDLRGRIALQQGNAPTATAYYRESLTIWQAIGKQEGTAVCLVEAGA
jgi:hypothetical protein